MTKQRGRSTVVWAAVLPLLFGACSRSSLDDTFFDDASRGMLQMGFSFTDENQEAYRFEGRVTLVTDSGRAVRTVDIEDEALRVVTIPLEPGRYEAKVRPGYRCQYEGSRGDFEGCSFAGPLPDAFEVFEGETTSIQLTFIFHFSDGPDVIASLPAGIARFAFDPRRAQCVSCGDAGDCEDGAICAQLEGERAARCYDLCEMGSDCGAGHDCIPAGTDGFEVGVCAPHPTCVGAACDATEPAGKAATAQDLLVAFIGDQGNGDDADAVLQLIGAEGAHATLHNGDFDYVDDPAAFEARIDGILGEDYPYFAVVGNHDALAWYGAGGYGERLAARVARVPEMECTGEVGVQANCYFRGLHLLQSCIGTHELSHRCAPDHPEQLRFIRDSLATDDHLWSICAWHKNQHQMQVGNKPDEVGWGAYRDCMSAGAIIATGHDHTYARSLVLSDVGNSAAGHGALGSHDLLRLSPCRSLVFVSGIGGKTLRPFDLAHEAATWWSSYYTSDRWMRHGQLLQAGPETGAAGALFVRFHAEGDPRLAQAYFKDIRGRVVDTFSIRVE